MILSDKGIREAIRRGSLSIEPFDVSRLGPMSYDIAVDRLYERKWDREPRDGMLFEEFLASCCAPLEKPELEPGKSYFGASKEVVASRLPACVATRSSLARYGMEATTDTEFLFRDGRVPFIIRTHNTRVRLHDSYPVAQLVFNDGIPLDEGEIEDAVSGGEISISGNCMIVRENHVFPYMSFGYMPSYASVLLHMDRMLKRYKGGTMDISQDPLEHFEDVDISGGYALQPGEFYLGSTEEAVAPGNMHAGRLMGLFGDFGNAVHLNAPWVQPGSGVAQVLEISVHDTKIVRAGMPICRMEIHRLDQEPERSYANVGRYAGQNGPATSRSCIDFR